MEPLVPDRRNSNSGSAPFCPRHQGQHTYGASRGILTAHITNSAHLPFGLEAGTILADLMEGLRLMGTLQKGVEVIRQAHSGYYGVQGGRRV